MMDSEFRDTPAHHGPGGQASYHASTFDPVPPSMAQLRQQNTASIVSSAGIAGQGAYPYAAGAGAGAAGAGIQERQPYTYGQGYDAHGRDRDDEGSELAHGGPYSSEPHPQAVYNAEAYGSYAYSTDVRPPQQAYQQPAQYNPHPYQAREYQQHYTDNAHGQGQGRGNLPPALVAGAPAVPAGRVTPTHMSDEDAYGGI